MEASLLTPLGMNHSAFAKAPDLSPLGAKAYRSGKPADELPLRDIPAGGLNTSVLDLSRFIEMVFAGGKSGEQQIIKPETLAEMLRPQNTNVPLDFDFRIGLAWMLGSNEIRNAGPVAQHGGATLNHHSQLIVLPEQKLGVVVMSNSATALGLVNRVATETLTLALEAKSGIKQPEKIDTIGNGEGSMSQEDLQTYVGRYSTVFGLINVTKKSDYLQAEFMGKKMRLVPREDGRLELKYKLLGIFPINLGKLGQVGISRKTVAGREVVTAKIDGREMLVGERIKPVPISEAMQKWVGEYEVVNAGDDAFLAEKVRLRLDNGLLLAEYAMPLLTDQIVTMAISPVSDSEAITCGLGRGMGETIQVVNVNGEEMIRFSGYLLKKKKQQ
jgi:hypothetical protein